MILHPCKTASASSGVCTITAKPEQQASSRASKPPDGYGYLSAVFQPQFAGSEVEEWLDGILQPAWYTSEQITTKVSPSLKTSE